MFRVDANGASIPAIGLGTWALKGEACIDLVAHALATGYRHIDTATAYGNEADVGQGLPASGLPRSAARHGRTPGQIVLRRHVALPRTRKKQHVEENFAIFDFTLSQAEMAPISALSAANSRICDFGFAPQWD